MLVAPLSPPSLSPTFPPSSHSPFLLPSAIVGHCDLSSDNVDDTLRHHALSSRMRGIRHMVNFHPDYPQYSETKHDNYLTDKKWIEGFALLQKHQMSFDLAVLPTQLKR